MTPTSPPSSPRFSPTNALQLRFADSPALRRFTLSLALLGALLALAVGVGNTGSGIATLLAVALMVRALVHADPAGAILLLNDSHGDFLLGGGKAPWARCQAQARGRFRGFLWLECSPPAGKGDPLATYLILEDALDDEGWRLLRHTLAIRGSRRPMV